MYEIKNKGLAPVPIKHYGLHIIDQNNLKS